MGFPLFLSIESIDMQDWKKHPAKSSRTCHILNRRCHEICRKDADFLLLYMCNLTAKAKNNLSRVEKYERK